MSEIVVTIIIWFILVSFFFHGQEYVWTNQDMLNLVRAGPRLLKFVLVGLYLLKLVPAGRCLLNLVRADPHIIHMAGYPVKENNCLERVAYVHVYLFYFFRSIVYKSLRI